MAADGAAVMLGSLQPAVHPRAPAPRRRKTTARPMTDATENVDRPPHPDRASVDLEAVRASSRQARARAAELRVQLEERRRQYRRTSVRADQRTDGPAADELAELRTRAE